jgi:hypothetical protein
MVNGTGFFNVPVACCEAGAIRTHRAKAARITTTPLENVAMLTVQTETIAACCLEAVDRVHAIELPSTDDRSRPILPEAPATV